MQLRPQELEEQSYHRAAGWHQGNPGCDGQPRLPRGVVVVECSSALSSLALEESNRVAITQRGGIRIILEALSNPMSHVGVLEECFRALGILVCKNNNIKVTIAQEGGIRIILGAMSNHMSHVGVLEQGFALLSNLTVKNDNKQVAIAQQGGTRAILEAMRNHRSHALVQEKSCWALLHVWRSKQGMQRQIKQAGGKRQSGARWQPQRHFCSQA